jgi:hypothetical protein
MAGIFSVLLMVVFFVGLVSVVRPIGRFGIHTRRAGGLVLLASMVGFFLVGASSTSDPSTWPTEEAPAEAPAAAPAAPAEPPKPQTPEDRVRASVAPRLNKATYIEASDKPDQTILVQWSPGANLTENLTKLGAQYDVVAILRGVAESGVPYRAVRIQGSAPMTDQYGNTEERGVIDLRYDRATIERINWESFLARNVYTVADRAVVHPVFRP